MAKDIYTLAYELKDLLNNDPRIKDLNEKEEKMKNDKEVLLLVNRKEEAISSYEDSFKTHSEPSKEKQKLLYQSKLELDSHPLVKSYLDAYAKVRDLYFEMNDILFSNLNLHLKECK